MKYKTKMSIGILILIPFISIGFSFTEDLINEIAIAEDAYRLENGKYRQITSDGLTEVHEYTTGKGETGYQIFIYDGDLITSYGYGLEAEERTYTWNKTNK